MTDATDQTNDESARARPVYVITASPQGDDWLLTADLPGTTVSHVVRSLDHVEWVLRELRTVIASHLGNADDSFDLVLQE